MLIEIALAIPAAAGLYHALSYTPLNHWRKQVRRRLARSNEILPDVPKPSYILAQMIAAKLIQGPVSIAVDGDSTSKYATRICSVGDELVVSFNINTREHPYLEVPEMLRVRKPASASTVFDPSEKEIINEALSKAIELEKMRVEAEKQAKVQEDALKAIEVLTFKPDNRILPDYDDEISPQQLQAIRVLAGSVREIRLPGAEG